MDTNTNILTKLKAEREVLKLRIENWKSKEMPPYKREVERMVQMDQEIERLSALLQRHNKTSALISQCLPDQHSGLRDVIVKKRARITEIERTLNRPPLTEYRGRPVHGGQSWRLRLEEERQHLLLAVRDLEAEEGRLRTDAKQTQPSLTQNGEKTVQAVKSKPSGRPRKDTEREMVRQLKAKGESWKGIAEKVNTQTGQNKSPEAYRSLLKTRSGTTTSPGKNGQK
jgi:hypothetical protein